MSAQVPAGWYPDGSGNDRFWDGSTWTEATRAQNPMPRAAAEVEERHEGVFSRVKRAASDHLSAKKAAQEEFDRLQAEAARLAGPLVTSGVFGTSSIEIFESGYVRVAVGNRESSEAAKITTKTPFEKLRSIKYSSPAEEKAAAQASALDGVVGSAVSSLFKGGASLMKSSVPGLAVAGVAHLASAESRRAYLTIATDKAIHNLTNESNNGMMVRSNKAHNQVGAELAHAGMSVLGLVPGPAQESAAPPASSLTTGPSIAERLRELAGLHRDGILSDQEFVDAKAKLLAGL